MAISLLLMSFSHHIPIFARIQPRCIGLFMALISVFNPAGTSSRRVVVPAFFGGNDHVIDIRKWR
jgi:hypothetical protein